MGKFSGRTGGGRRGRERGGEPGEGEAHASLSRQPRVHTGAGGRRARGCAGAGSPGTVAAGPEWSDGCVLSLTLNVGVFTPWKWAIATIQGFFFFFPSLLLPTSQPGGPGTVRTECTPGISHASRAALGMFTP